MSYAVGIPTVVARLSLLAARLIVKSVLSGLLLVFIAGTMGMVVAWVGGLAGGLVGTIIDLPLPVAWELGERWVAVGAVLAVLYMAGAAGYDVIVRRRTTERPVLGRGRQITRALLAQVSVDRATAQGIMDALESQRSRDLARIDVPRPAGAASRRSGRPRPAYAWPAALVLGPRRETRLGEPQLTIEPFVGWRRWSVAPGTMLRRPATEPVLTGVVIASPWEHAELVASCSPHQRWPIWGPAPVSHLAPDVDCRCGIYALKAPGLADWAAVGVWAEGPVRLWGRVLEGRNGFRAERARVLGPLALRMGCRWPRTPETWLAHACPMEPATVLVEDDEYVPLCSQHAALISDRGLSFTEFMSLMADGLRSRYGVEILGREQLWT